jgi:hypothetical protein
MRRLFLLLLCAVSLSLHAQRITRQYRNVSMADALRELNTLQHQYTVNFIYDELEDFRVTTTVRGLSVPDAIRQLIGFYPIRMTQQDHVLLVECTHKTQHHLTGHIIDELGEAVPFANILLLSPIDSTVIAGGVSNESGVFVVPYEPAKVLAKISYVGYKTVYRTFTSEQAGTIQLVPETKMLQAVKVKAMRPQYKMVRGGVLTDVEHSVLSQMGSALDVLGQLPRVLVSGNNIEVFGKGTPLVYINNKLVKDSHELTQLRSENIKNVEVITSPGAEFNATVGSVIRIRTIRRVADGLSMQTIAYNSYNSKWAGQVYNNTAYSTEKIEIFNKIFVDRSIDRENNHLINRLHTHGNDIDVDQKTKFNMRSDVLSETVGASYFFNDSNSVGASYRFYTTLDTHAPMLSQQQILRNNLLEGNVLMNGDISIFYGPRHNVEMYYVGKLGKLGIDFNSSYLSMKSHEVHDYTEQSKELADRTINSRSKQHSTFYAGKLVCTYPLWTGKWLFGSEASHTRSAGDYVNEEGLVDNSNTNIKESNLAFFTSYGLPLGEFYADAGLRYEHVISDYYSYGVRQPDTSRKYDDFFPVMSLSWNHRTWQFQLNYNKRTIRPGYRSLRNFIQYDNRYMYEGGNPALQPMVKHNIELSAIHHWISFSAGYSYLKDVILWTKAIMEGKEATLSRSENFDHQSIVYANLSLSPKFDWYLPSLTIGYSQQSLDADKLGIKEDMNKPWFSVAFHNNFQISKTCLATLNLYCVTRKHNDLQIQKPSARISASIRQSFMDNRLIVQLRANNLFNIDRERWTIYGRDVKMTKDGDNYTQSISLSLSYNLNMKRSKYKGTGAGNDEKQRL